MLPLTHVLGHALITALVALLLLWQQRRYALALKVLGDLVDYHAARQRDIEMDHNACVADLMEAEARFTKAENERDALREQFMHAAPQKYAALYPMFVSNLADAITHSPE